MSFSEEKLNRLVTFETIDAIKDPSTPLRMTSKRALRMTQFCPLDDAVCVRMMTVCVRMMTVCVQDDTVNALEDKALCAGWLYHTK